MRAFPLHVVGFGLLVSACGSGAGAAVELDAGPEVEVDAARVVADGGARADSSVTGFAPDADVALADAGTVTVDADVPAVDGGTPAVDAGVAVPDAGAMEVDAGPVMCGDGLQDHDGDGVCAPACAAGTCNAHGACNDASGFATCACDTGYAGDACNTCATGYQDHDGDGVCAPACAAGTCNAHGACNDASGIATCACDTGYAGDACNTCATGYQDHDGDGRCEPACAAGTCNAHGACNDASGFATCACDTGYAGDACNTCATGYQDHDGDGRCAPACAAGTCNAHGACNDASGIATCACDTGYAGDACNTCATGYQDHDGDGRCAPACSITACAEACQDTTGTAVCVCAPGCGGANHCHAGACVPVFFNISAGVGGESFTPRPGPNARYVSFHATGAAPGVTDTNGLRDAYVYDRTLGTYDLVSRASDGVSLGNGASTLASMSDDGRWVAFQSGSSNLVPGDVNGTDDVFLFDRTTRTLEHVSAGLASGVLADTITLDPTGRYAVFRSRSTTLVPGANGSYHVFFYDRVMHTYELVSVATGGTQGNGDSSAPWMSADARYVTFTSLASNLVAGDTNGQGDVFVRDRVAGTTERVSLSSAGAQGNGLSQGSRISGDGRYVVFHSAASTLVSGDTNGTIDVFVRDRTLGSTVRVSVRTDGTEAMGGTSFNADISRDGRYVAFTSGATNLASGDANGQNDVFVYDLATSTLRTASATVTGVIGDQASDNARFSPDGRFLTFNSRATNLVSGAGGTNDALMRDLAAPY